MDLFHRKNQGKEAFWVLKDVSFAVEPGEVVGIIGPNGAGKSTILKLISRIIEPTSGQVSVEGRVGALLELGAGFHPDLTGRENIYLNGSLLGLSRGEISRKIDAIIDFAELETFIDVPVKHYSSGMYVRLGFSVAVHTEPEILLVDEVLAVGDAAFQRKCLERIEQLEKAGCTIVFVSHDLNMMQRLCSRIIWLDEGRVIDGGNPESIVQQYIMWSMERENAKQRLRSAVDHRWGGGDVEIIKVRLLNEQNEEKDVFQSGETLVIEIRYRAARAVSYPVFGLAIHTGDGVYVTGPNTLVDGHHIPEVAGEGRVSYRIDALPLLEGQYFISASAHNEQETVMYSYHDRLYPLTVLRPEQGQHYGLVVFDGRWSWN